MSENIKIMTTNKQKYLDKIKAIIDDYNKNGNYIYQEYLLKLQFDKDKDDIEIELHHIIDGDEPYMYVGYNGSNAYMGCYAIEKDHLDEYGTFTISPFKSKDLKVVLELIKAIENYYQES